MLKYFNTSVFEIPVVVIDTETTGVRAGHDRAVQVGIVRFEGGVPVERFCSLVDPRLEVPAAATEVHGITNEMLRDQPTIEQVWATPEVQRLIEGAQPAAYNAGFDRHFVPPFGPDWAWPWLDSLSMVRVLDRFERGSGRHKLAATCARHGVALDNAHSAEADARAAGELLFKLIPRLELKPPTLGAVLGWQRKAEAHSWFDFHSWLSRQPPRVEGAAS